MLCANQPRSSRPSPPPPLGCCQWIRGYGNGHHRARGRRCVPSSAITPQADLLLGAPGLGPILAARVLGEIGDDPNRFTTAAGLRAFAGTAPITRASGRTKTVSARQVRNRRLSDACHWWASPRSRNHPVLELTTTDVEPPVTDTTPTLRNLANKLLGRLWWCLVNNQPWDEAAAWPTTTEPDHRTAA